MNHMLILEEMSWVLGPVFVVIAIITLLRSEDPPTPGSNGMTDGDYYFMNEWCDGDN